MFKPFRCNGILVALTMLALVLGADMLSASSASAGRPVPPNNPKRGLIYNGLGEDTDGSCKGAFQVKLNRSSGRVECTHGPDEPPAKLDVALSVEPLPPSTTSSVAPIQCDGDGVSGKRVQMIYAHASDVPDRYALYADSFLQWTAGMDAIFQASAAATGGTRHVRFVQDASCKPVIPNVQLSPTGDDDFGTTIYELQSLGFNRTDRKYIVFVDAHVYCGIGGISGDDQPGPGNRNNSGPDYGRVDNGCWGAVTPAHELMHTLGGVQFSAPHSAQEWHSYDGWDIMSRPTNGTPIQVLCADSSFGSLFDCNHDDYFNTNALAGSYLATHWNAANSQFLTGSFTRVDSVVTGQFKGKTFTATDTFKSNETVIAQAHVVNENQAGVSGATVTFAVTRPDGTIQCTVTATSDGNGFARGECRIPGKSPKGTWRGNVKNVVPSVGTFDTTKSVNYHNFTVN